MENEKQIAENNGYHDNVFSLPECETDEHSREHSPMPLSSHHRPGYIEHSVSKSDTLVGIAIKYGVEVADIKKMNGLVTDYQMFALKTIHIPLPGRHPQSPLPSGSGTAGQGNPDHSPSDYAHRELFKSFRSLSRVKSSGRKVSPAMSSLQGYYGLKSTSNYVENGSTKSDRTLAHHRKSRSLVNIIFEDVMQKTNTKLAAKSREENSNRWNDKLVQRHQKSEADFTRIPELLLKEDTSSNVGLPSRAGKRLSLRPKYSNRISLENDSELSGLSPMVTTSNVDAFLVTDGSSGVRKSSSTSCLQDHDNNSSSYIWPTSMWSLKSDLQSLPKPTTSRRNKAALD